MDGNIPRDDSYGASLERKFWNLTWMSPCPRLCRAEPLQYSHVYQTGVILIQLPILGDYARGFGALSLAFPYLISATPVCPSPGHENEQVLALTIYFSP